MLVGVLLLGGCSTNANKPTSKATSKESQSSSVTKKTSKTTSQLSQSSHEKKTVAQSRPVAATLWNKTKEQKLAKFMQTWQSEMGQTYKETYNGDKPDHMGFVFPDVIKDGKLNGKVKWGNRKINLTWSNNGENGNEFQIVEVATGGKSGTGFPTTYLFCLHNNRPVVFMTQTTNGGILYLQDTQNAELQAGFAEIVTGTNPAILTDASLNTDVKSSVKASPQRWPSAYQGTWYSYSPYDKKISSIREEKISDVELAYITIQKIRWFNIRGKNQTSGDGAFEYVRYRYYDGQQIPVMMLASGAGAWSDGNAYQSKAIAAQMQDFKFGDESKTQDDD